MAIVKFVQAQKFSLSGSGATIGDTTITLQSMLGIDGVAITTTDIGDVGFGTLEPGNGTQEEAISFTGITQNANGTATLTGVKHVLFISPYTGTSGITKTHAGASIFILSNDAAFYGNILSYVDTALSSGAVPATTSVNGIVTLTSTPASASTPIVIGANTTLSSGSVTLANPVVDYNSLSLGSVTKALSALYPVNSIYMEISGTNPATTFGFGTWSAYGAGRVLIGAGTGTKVATFASRSSNVITVTGLTNAANNEFQTGQAVLYSAPSGAMTGLTHNTTYYIVKVSALTFSLASSLANAQNGTVISLSSDGTGTQTFTLTLTARTGGDTGGEENHAMSSTELLAHTHTLSNDTGSVSSGGGGNGSTSTSSNFAQPSVNATGGNAAMNNMQPFVAVYIWLRTA